MKLFSKSKSKEENIFRSLGKDTKDVFKGFNTAYQPLCQFIAKAFGCKVNEVYKSDFLEIAFFNFLLEHDRRLEPILNACGNEIQIAKKANFFTDKAKLNFVYNELSHEGLKTMVQYLQHHYEPLQARLVELELDSQKQEAIEVNIVAFCKTILPFLRPCRELLKLKKESLDSEGLREIKYG